MRTIIGALILLATGCLPDVGYPGLPCAHNCCVVGVCVDRMCVEGPQ